MSLTILMPSDGGRETALPLHPREIFDDGVGCATPQERMPFVRRMDAVGRRQRIAIAIPTRQANLAVPADPGTVAIGGYRYESRQRIAERCGPRLHRSLHFQDRLRR